MILNIVSNETMAQRIKVLFPEDEVLAWGDALYEGPLFEGALSELTVKRARYFCDVGLADENELMTRFQAIHQKMAQLDQYDEVNLWFADNLFDQLQLVQLLNWFANNDTGRTAINLVQQRALDEKDQQELYRLWDKRIEVSMLQLSIGQTAWNCLCAEDPRDIQNYLANESSVLPYLKAALQRILQQFPSQLNGLNRSERQILEMLSAGETDANAIYNGAQNKEETPFMSRAVFSLYLKRMMECDEPLLKKTLVESEGTGHWQFSLTELGRNVLRYKADWVQLNGINRWVGGIHLQPGMIWRWDPKRQQLIRTYT